MKCRCCGSQMDASETRCSYCGTTIKNENQHNTQSESGYTSSYYDIPNQGNGADTHNYGDSQNYTQPYTYQPYKYEPERQNYEYTNYKTPVNNSNTISSLPTIMSILSIFFGFSGFGFIFAIIAMVTGARAKQSSNEYERNKGRSAFTIGLVMLIIDIVIGGLFFLMMLISGFAAYQ